MKTVNSLSGGKTSSYVAANYPADYDLFALVCIDNHNANASNKIDPFFKKYANDKLQKTSSHWPEFVATSEDPIILTTMYELEQFIGKEITWVRGMGWEKMLQLKRAIPNRSKRFCTTILKMIPIFEYLYTRGELPVKMRLGYRYDEKERQETFDDTFRYATHCEKYWNLDEIKNPIIRNAARQHSDGFYYVHRWEDIIWRVGEFPLLDDKIWHHNIIDFWKDKPVPFAPDSNCQNCFWKDPQQLRKNFDNNRSIMLWSMIWEDLIGHTFKDELSFKQISNLGLQLDFFFGTGSGCQAGFCTD